MRKMHASVAYHAQGKHRERYGIGNFRVITVTPTRQRALNLCRKLQDAGLASKGFWFASIEPISPDELERLLEKIFCTPKDYQAGARYGFGD